MDHDTTETQNTKAPTPHPFTERLVNLDHSIRQLMQMLDCVQDLSNEDLEKFETISTFSHDRLGIVWRTFALELKQRNADGRIKMVNPMEELAQRMGGMAFRLPVAVPDDKDEKDN